MKMTLKDFGEDRVPLVVRLLLSPVRIAFFIIMTVPAILIEAAGEDGMAILDFIWDIGNE